MTDPIADIDAMAERVAALLCVFERDPLCAWTPGFRAWLADAAAIRADATREDATRLAIQLSCAFRGGLGSFNDYIPQIDRQPAPWTDEAWELSQRVAAIAWEVRQGVVTPSEPA